MKVDKEGFLRTRSNEYTNNIINEYVSNITSIRHIKEEIERICVLLGKGKNNFFISQFQLL